MSKNGGRKYEKNYCYFLIIENEYLVVYDSNKEIVLERTDIHSDKLSEMDSIRMKDGIFLKDDKELYGILQGYSS